MTTDPTSSLPIEHTPDTVSLDTGGVTRREALASAVRGAAGLFLLLPMWSARAQAAPAQWVVAGKAAQFIKGQPQRVALAGGAVLYVTRLTPTTLSAVSAKCTHKGCEVAWDGAGSQLACPCHGAAFAASGKNLHGTRRNPAETLPALASVPAAQKKDQVLVNLAGIAPDLLQPGR